MQKNQDGIVKQDIKSITIPEADRTWKKGDIRYTKQGIRVEFKGDNLYNIAGEDRIFNTDTPNASSFQRSIDMAIYSVNPMETPNVYMIKGDQHERVSYAIKRVYDVFGLKPETLTVLNNAFDVTIGVKGFNEASVTAFIEELKAQKASDIDGVMNGFSTYTFDEIRDELLGYFDVMAIMGKPSTGSTSDIEAKREAIEKRRQEELLFVKPYNQGLKTVSLDDINKFSNSFKKDGTTIKVYAATNNKSKLSKEGFSGENTGLGTTKGEAPGTIFLTPFLSTALDYANMYAGEGFPLNQIDIVEVELKNGEGTIEGVEIRTRKESIVSVKALNRKKDSTDKIKKEIIARYAAQLDALEGTTQTTTTPGAVDIEEVRKLALNTAAEQTYEASKGVGNYADAQSKRVFDGEEAVFDEEKITKEAFDALFDPKTGYLTGLKQRADKGEFFIATS
jgi:hypothetical protein